MKKDVDDVELKSTKLIEKVARTVGKLNNEEPTDIRGTQAKVSLISRINFWTSER